jgi:hypothetical protein
MKKKIQVTQNKQGSSFLITEGGEDGGAEDALASCPSIRGRVSQAPDHWLQSYGGPRPIWRHHLLPLDGLCVPERKP